ncbi:MAG: hypothetical protein HC822_03840 [Oscillochloris sp.]|nr:hypothetical protein [Oscillochloris sp.]
MLRQTLARQVLFFPGLPPVPILAPQCYWALIALAEIGNPQLLLPWPRRRLVRAALQRLQSIAAGIALSAGWAGFWDQWVLSEAQRQWSKPKSNSASPLHQALAALPLHQSAGATVPQHEQPPFTLANPNWEQERPPWFDLLAQWNRKETPDHV